jgi:hypothetical protein
MFQDGGCAVAQDGSSTNAFFQTGAGAIVNWFSSNNGVSWSSTPGTILTPPSSALTKGISSAGNADVFFLYDVSGGEAIGCSFFTSSWSSIHTWTLSPMAAVGSMSGLAVYWDGTLYHIVYSDGYALKQVTCNSAGTVWTALPDISPSDVSALARTSPRIAKFDNLYNLICVESDSGVLTGSVYSYSRLRQSADLIHWSNGRIMQDVSTTYGVNLLKVTPPSASRAVYVLSAMSGIQLNNDFQQSDASEYLDVSSKIESYKRVDQLDKPCTLELVLDNENSSLTSSVADYVNEVYAPIGIHTLVNFSEGYYTGTPPTTQESINVGKYHIQKITFERSPGVSQIQVLARDLTLLLDIESRFQNVYTDQIVSWLITEVCARAGIFSVSLPATSQMSVTVTTFTLHAGQKYRNALNELCRIGWLEYFLDQTETLIFKELSGSDTSIWTYQPEIERWSIGTEDIQANHTIVTGQRSPGGALGNITTGESYDNIHAHAVAFERVAIAHDQKLTSAVLCADAAAFIQAQDKRDQYDHVIVAPCNPALQLLDAVETIDDGQQSTSIDNTSRIIKQEITFDSGKAVYEQLISMEGL